ARPDRDAANDGPDLPLRFATVVDDVAVVADAVRIQHAAEPEIDGIQQRAEIALAVSRPLPADLAAGREERSAQSDEAVHGGLEHAQAHFVPDVGALPA